MWKDFVIGNIPAGFGLGSLQIGTRASPEFGEDEVSKIRKWKVFKPVAWLLAIGIAVVMLARWAGVDSIGIVMMLIRGGNPYIQWEEEVRMADGTMLHVDRTAKGKMSGEIGSPWGWRKTGMSVEVVKQPANWAPPPPIWHSNEYAPLPLLLDYQSEEHTWSLIATFSYCASWEQLGRPALPYVEYQSKNGGPWQVIPLEERLIGRKANLLISPSYEGEPQRDLTKWLRKRIPNYKETPDMVTAEEKDWRNRNAGKKYKDIVSNWNGCK